jgi:predicted metal-binding membrane protein
MTLTLRETAPLWAALAAVGGLAWVVTVDQAQAMGAGPGTMGMAFLLFTGTWVVMMAAMMLPAIGPMAAAETSIGGAPASRVAGVLAFGAGFLLPWAAYGVLAFLAFLGTDPVVEASPGGARWLGGAIFVVAGVYQFSPWKHRALSHCRTAMATSTRTGLAKDLVAGSRDGAMCVGCCWALMTILIPLGVMSLAGMVGLAAVIFTEKILPRPRLVASLVGLAFLVLAIVAFVKPSLFPGLSPEGAGMSLDGAEVGGMGM